MTPKAYAKYANKLLVYRRAIFVVMLAGMVLFILLIIIKHPVAGFAIAGPFILIPWVIFLLCYWFRQNNYRWSIILWLQAIMLDILIIIALSWPFIVIFG
ncbi:hypothetical protein [Rhodanobacter soli]|uniref:Uncharacterized protein n=1 Tax=Rhodanobacter soli TaxID=590609 RepID=A0ABV2Q1J1_9GAMM